jgi:hypothetical protein
MNPPKHAGYLRPYLDVVYIYLPKKGWIPQLSVLNCNREQVWKILTDKKLAKIHYLRCNQPQGDYSEWKWDEEKLAFASFNPNED